MNAVSVYVYKKFGSKQLVELLLALGFASSYSETSILELSTIVRQEQIVVNEGAFLQFIFDNADFNVNTLDGLHTFQAMGGIMVTTPYDSMAPNIAVARVTNCKSSEFVKKAGPIELDVYKKKEKTLDWKLSTLQMSRVFIPFKMKFCLILFIYFGCMACIQQM
ncbi:hypothetical protein AVEN_71415-1 [Araneus ventricosus]|uniref:Uncharacterized protein n=1 Tax=Araneus ventricosus TaxID=182803 RepID=A0A4Y2BHN9_ARAVE|nr:hypothetical protein AVEN_71415-1 [Araneus ventricosus]